MSKLLIVRFTAQPRVLSRLPKLRLLPRCWQSHAKNTQKWSKCYGFRAARDPRDRGCVGAGRPPILDGVTTRTKSSCLLGAEVAATAVRATGPGLDAIGASHDMASDIIRARR